MSKPCCSPDSQLTQIYSSNSLPTLLPAREPNPNSIPENSLYRLAGHLASWLAVKYERLHFSSKKSLHAVCDGGMRRGNAKVALTKQEAPCGNGPLGRPERHGQLGHCPCHDHCATALELRPNRPRDEAPQSTWYAHRLPGCLSHRTHLQQAPQHRNGQRFAAGLAPHHVHQPLSSWTGALARVGRMPSG